jgi:hypothetical protein
MINILLVSIVLLIIIVSIVKVVNKLFDESQLEKEFEYIIRDVDMEPLLPREAELASIPASEEPEVYAPETEMKTKPVSRNPGKPRKRNRKSKLNV